MKKLAFFIIGAALCTLASCDTKSCRCYEYSGGRWTGPRTYTTQYGTACGALNTSTTYCNEMDDPILDPNDIAIGKKKQTR